MILVRGIGQPQLGQTVLIQARRSYPPSSCTIWPAGLGLCSARVESGSWWFRQLLGCRVRKTAAGGSRVCLHGESGGSGLNSTDNVGYDVVGVFGMAGQPSTLINHVSGHRRDGLGSVQGRKANVLCQGLP
jgi:hypothetical protein